MQRRSLVNKDNYLVEFTVAGFGAGAAGSGAAWAAGIVIVLVALLLISVIAGCIRHHNNTKSKYDVQNDSINTIAPYPTQFPELEYTNDNDSTLNNN